MTAATLERTANADDGFTRSRIKEGDMAHALITLSRQYSRPKDAVIRELATNALESHQAAGYTGPVEITLPSYRSPFLTITDHGLGLGLEDITEVIGDFAGSTKRHSGQATPNYGIGSKSPYAVADSYTVTTVKDGVRREVLFARLSDGNPGYKIISTENTVEPNGVTVRVPIREDDNPMLWLGAAQNVLYWWEKDTFQLYRGNIVTGDIEAVDTPCYRDQIESAVSTSNVMVMNTAFVRETKVFGSNSVIVRTGTTGYSVPSGFFADLALPTYGLGYLAVEMPRDSIKVSPDRESIEDTEANRQQVYAALQKWSETVSSLYLTKLDAATSSYNLYRVWNEATHIEHVLTNTTYFDRVGEQYGMATRAEVSFIGYSTGRARQRRIVLFVDDLTAMVKSPCLILEELDSRAAGIIAKWRSAHGKPAVYVFSAKEDVRPLIDPDEIEWVTLADLKAETPTKRPAEPVVALSDTDTVDRIWYVRGYHRGAVKTSAIIGDLKKLLADGLPLVIGAAKDFEDLDINYDKVVAIACATRKPKVIETAMGQKAATPAAYMRSLYVQEVAALDDEQKQAYVERATLPKNAIRNAWYVTQARAQDADGEWTLPRHSEAVLEAIKPLSELEAALDPVYAGLPGMPEPRLGIEFKHTVALLDELYNPSELLLKMALRADKMAAGDRRRRNPGKTAGTK
jgi:hypothetical protein